MSAPTALVASHHSQSGRGSCRQSSPLASGRSHPAQHSASSGKRSDARVEERGEEGHKAVPPTFLAGVGDALPRPAPPLDSRKEGCTKHSSSPSYSHGGDDEGLTHSSSQQQQQQQQQQQPSPPPPPPPPPLSRLDDYMNRLVAGGRAAQEGRYGEPPNADRRSPPPASAAPCHEYAGLLPLTSHTSSPPSTPPALPSLQYRNSGSNHRQCIAEEQQGFSPTVVSKQQGPPHSAVSSSTTNATNITTNATTTCACAASPPSETDVSSRHAYHRHRSHCGRGAIGSSTASAAVMVLMTDKRSSDRSGGDGASGACGHRFLFGESLREGSKTDRNSERGVRLREGERKSGTSREQRSRRGDSRSRQLSESMLSPQRPSGSELVFSLFTRKAVATAEAERHAYNLPVPPPPPPPFASSSSALGRSDRCPAPPLSSSSALSSSTTLSTGFLVRAQSHPYYEVEGGRRMRRRPEAEQRKQSLRGGGGHHRANAADGSSLLSVEALLPNPESFFERWRHIREQQQQQQQQPSPQRGNAVASPEHAVFTDAYENAVNESHKGSRRSCTAEEKAPTLTPGSAAHPEQRLQAEAVRLTETALSSQAHGDERSASDGSTGATAEPSDYRQPGRRRGGSEGDAASRTVVPVPLPSTACDSNLSMPSPPPHSLDDSESRKESPHPVTSAFAAPPQMPHFGAAPLIGVAASPVPPAGGSPAAQPPLTLIPSLSPAPPLPQPQPQPQPQPPTDLAVGSSRSVSSVISEEAPPFSGVTPRPPSRSRPSAPVSLTGSGHVAASGNPRSMQHQRQQRQESNSLQSISSNNGGGTDNQSRSRREAPPKLEHLLSIQPAQPPRNPERRDNSSPTLSFNSAHTGIGLTTNDNSGKLGGSSADRLAAVATAAPLLPSGAVTVGGNTNVSTAKGFSSLTATEEGETMTRGQLPCRAAVVSTKLSRFILAAAVMATQSVGRGYLARRYVGFRFNRRMGRATAFEEACVRRFACQLQSQLEAEQTSRRAGGGAASGDEGGEGRLPPPPLSCFSPLLKRVKPHGDKGNGQSPSSQRCANLDGPMGDDGSGQGASAAAAARRNRSMSDSTDPTVFRSGGDGRGGPVHATSSNSTLQATASENGDGLPYCHSGDTNAPHIHSSFSLSRSEQTASFLLGAHSQTARFLGTDGSALLVDVHTASSNPNVDVDKQPQTRPSNGQDQDETVPEALPLSAALQNHGLAPSEGGSAMAQAPPHGCPPETGDDTHSSNLVPPPPGGSTVTHQPKALVRPPLPKLTSLPSESSMSIHLELDHGGSTTCLAGAPTGVVAAETPFPSPPTGEGGTGGVDGSLTDGRGAAASVVDAPHQHAGVEAPPPPPQQRPGDEVGETPQEEEEVVDGRCAEDHAARLLLRVWHGYTCRRELGEKWGAKQEEASLDAQLQMMMMMVDHRTSPKPPRAVVVASASALTTPSLVSTPSAAAAVGWGGVLAHRPSSDGNSPSSGSNNPRVSSNVSCEPSPPLGSADGELAPPLALGFAQIASLVSGEFAFPSCPPQGDVFPVSTTEFPVTPSGTLSSSQSGHPVGGARNPNSSCPTSPSQSGPSTPSPERSPAPAVAVSGSGLNSLGHFSNGPANGFSPSVSVTSNNPTAVDPSAAADHHQSPRDFSAHNSSSAGNSKPLKRNGHKERADPTHSPRVSFLSHDVVRALPRAASEECLPMPPSPTDPRASERLAVPPESGVRPHSLKLEKWTSLETEPGAPRAGADAASAPDLNELARDHGRISGRVARQHSPPPLPRLGHLPAASNDEDDDAKEWEGKGLPLPPPLPAPQDNGTTAPSVSEAEKSTHQFVAAIQQISSIGTRRGDGGDGMASSNNSSQEHSPRPSPPLPPSTEKTDNGNSNGNTVTASTQRSNAAAGAYLTPVEGDSIFPSMRSLSTYSSMPFSLSTTAQSGRLDRTGSQSEFYLSARRGNKGANAVDADSGARRGRIGNDAEGGGIGGRDDDASSVSRGVGTDGGSLSTAEPWVLNGVELEASDVGDDITEDEDDANANSAGRGGGRSNAVGGDSGSSDDDAEDSGGSDAEERCAFEDDMQRASESVEKHFTTRERLLRHEGEGVTAREAVQLLQRVGRGYLCRRRQHFLFLLSISWPEISLICRLVLGYQAREKLGYLYHATLAAKKEMNYWEQRNRAAIALQRMARGFTARQRVRHLQRKLKARLELRIAVEQPDDGGY